MTDSLRFGRYAIDTARRQLRIDGTPAPLGARAFDVLVALADRRDRMVGKSELLDVVWPGLVVEENNLQVQVSTLRKLLGSGAIATIPGRGYRLTLVADAAFDTVAAAAADAPATAPAATSNLPGAPPPLIGRDADADGVFAVLAAQRLVTLAGAGGIGKTVLARSVAHRSLDRFRDGVWWVDLAALPGADAQAVAQAIAQAVGLPLNEGDATALLARALAPRQLLLVLDNCEHLAAAVAAVVAALRAAATGVALLATSQVALHLPGEQVWRLDALALPPPGATLLEQARGAAAFALFERRAREVDHRFVLDRSGVEHVVALCHQLDGNPLAIELAAARAPQLGVGPLRQRLSDRLQLLRSPVPTVPLRQQSLRATLDWSCSLLRAAERAVLRRLAVFAGSFRLDVALAVVADGELDEWAAVDALTALVDRSLLQIEPGDPPRYRLLESTRLHAGEQMGAAGETERSAAAHGRALARLALALLDDVHVLPAAALRERYGADHVDLDAAFESACARGDAAVAAACGQALAALDAAAGVAVLRRRRMAAAYALLPAAADPVDRARLWTLASPASSIALPDISRVDAAQQRADAWRAAGDRRELYAALALLAEQHARAGDHAAARATAAEALALETASWPPALRMAGAQMECDVALYAGDSAADAAAASRGLQRMLALAEQTGDPWRVAMARFRLAEQATGAGHVEQAIALGRASVAELEPARRPLILAMALANLCSACLQGGDDACARAAAARALPLLRPNLYAGVLFNHLALLAARAGDAACAGLLLGHADRWYAEQQNRLRQPPEQRLLEPALAAIESALGAARCAALRAEGAVLDDAAADALALRLLQARHDNEEAACRSASR